MKKEKQKRERNASGNQLKRKNEHRDLARLMKMYDLLTH